MRSLLEKSRAGMEESVRQGWQTGGPAPYGYALDPHPHPNSQKAREGRTKHRLVVDPVRGPIVLRIFIWYVEDELGLGTICDRLNSDLDRYPPTVRPVIRSWRGSRQARAFGSVTRSAAEAARRTLPFTDAGSRGGVGGVGRAVAQCGAIVTAAICSALIVATPPVEQVLNDGAANRAGLTPTVRSSTEDARPKTAPLIEVPARSSAAAREAEARRIERRRRDRAKHAARRRRAARLARVRRARKARAAVRADKGQRNEGNGGHQEEAPEATAPAPETFIPEEGETSPPPPATGAQTREEFNHL